ncbi:tyrosine-type recombinase/integrase [Urbifossiella limnaea]|uniref:Tn916 family transposase n=1 Tax=Urbifossiella limnaea TaxID=2528023 RepID=A0A517XW01_9BACT|nr:site-specific integrase [Urbifossiella limnaea]QDU21690.1 Tn916 family transposase [Urbifossiella limnaea]
MPPKKSQPSPRFRVGKVSVYEHHGAWWVYYRDDTGPHRKKVAATRDQAEQVAARVNSQLASNEPTLLTFTPIAVAELRKQFLDYHEHVLHSSVGTLKRYRSATQHLDDFVRTLPKPPHAHDLKVEAFAAYLRRVEVAPNGHQNTAKRKLLTKGVQYVLETCRTMFTYAVKRRHLPPYAGNPFSELPLDKMRIEDAKPIFVFTADTEMKFLAACSAWAFPINFTLAKTGLRVGELVHLLIEDVDLAGGWLHVHNKVELGWRVKTGQERTVPLLAEMVAVIRAVIGKRTCGPVFLRERLRDRKPVVVGDRRELEKVLRNRRAGEARPLTRTEEAGLAKKLWWDAGAVKADKIRQVFGRVTAAIGHPDSTCPKSWRHTFATLLQDGNVDPLIRQQVMGHKPTLNGGLGMTANYTHTRPETRKEQVERALRRWSGSLAYALERLGPV